MRRRIIILAVATLLVVTSVGVGAEPPDLKKLFQERPSWTVICPLDVNEDERPDLVMRVYFYKYRQKFKGVVAIFYDSIGVWAAVDGGEVLPPEWSLSDHPEFLSSSPQFALYFREPLLFRSILLREGEIYLYVAGESGLSPVEAVTLRPDRPWSGPVVGENSPFGRALIDWAMGRGAKPEFAPKLIPVVEIKVRDTPFGKMSQSDISTWYPQEAWLGCRPVLNQ